MNYKIFFGFVLGWILSGIIGYKYGDASGYKDGYEYGYRFDCKEEIGDLYKQVKNQSQALKYTDSAIRVVSHLNDSLMRKEYYQKRYADSILWRKNYSSDSLKLSMYARLYSDSLNKAINGYVTNIVQDDGRINILACMVEPYKSLRECQLGFDMHAELKRKVKVKKRKK